MIEMLGDHKIPSEDKPWTRFNDMHSGGGLKTDFAYIYIEAPEPEAIRIFEDRFGRNPSHVSCHCCGEDFSIRQADSLAEATAYERGCAYDGTIHSYVEKPDQMLSSSKYVTLDEYVKREGILVIRKTNGPFAELPAGSCNPIKSRKKKKKTG